MRTRGVERVLGVGVVAYFGAVVVAVVLDADLGLFRPGELGSSPAKVANGEVLRLISSGLVVDGPVPLLQVAGAAVLAWLVVHRHGARTWWAAALSGHLGSALVAYAFIGIAIAAGAVSAERISDQSDFGISAVVAATAGALFLGAAVRARRHGRAVDKAIAAACLAGLVLSIPFTLDWYGVEHPLAFALGAAALALVGRRRAPG